MNQILYVEEEVKKNRKVDVTKIVKFFSIVILIFGLVLTGKGSYGMYQKYNEEKIEKEQKSIPVISVERHDDTLTIKATHNKIISQIAYTWNKIDETIIVGNGENSLEKDIEIPVGESLLNVTVIDEVGNRAIFEEKYISNSTLKIDLIAVGSKIKITATDANGMRNIKAKWNNNEPEEVVATENDKKIELLTEIPIGENTLTVIAENANGRTQKKVQEIKGVKKPAVALSKDKEFLIIKVTDASGVASIDYTLNETTYRLTFISAKGADYYNKISGLNVVETETGVYSEIVYRQKLDEGDNAIKLKAINLQEASTEVSGQCTYTPQ